MEAILSPHTNHINPPIHVKRIILLISFLVLNIATARPQQSSDSPLTWEDFVSLMADETDDDNAPDQELFEELYELHTHPFNLNHTNDEQLRQLPFLTPADIDEILAYISTHSPLISTGELMFISALDHQKRKMLQLFCYATETTDTKFSLSNVLKQSANELTLRTDIPLYQKAGYKAVSDSILALNPNKHYRGNNLFHSLRYTFASQNHFYAGIQLEKDAGETYIDHIAGYAMLKDIGNIRTAVVGNYRISFGHGLVINTGSTFGKAMKMSSLETIDRGITRHSSTTEAGYLTGGAATLKFNNISVSAFASYRKADATLNNDSSGISSLKTDGLHRTPLEYSKKHNTTITDLGANLHFDLRQFQISLTAATTHFSAPLAPKYDTPSSLYRFLNPQGKNHTAASIAYTYRAEKVILSGETAINDRLALATIDQLQWTPNGSNTFTLLYRLYQAKYNAINAHSFGENSTVHNEHGIYIGWKNSISKALTLSSYLDLMYFPWLKFQVSGSSYGIESQSQLSYSPSSPHSFTLRYRFKSKQKDCTFTDENSSTTHTALRYKSTHTLRLQYTYAPSPSLALKTTASGTYIHFASESSRGYSFSENIRYTIIKRLRMDLGLTYFNTDDYESRIFTYEPSLLYTFAMTSNFGKGIRTILLCTYTPAPRLNLTLKFGTTHYFDRTTIGTALELIDASHREDIQLQFRWKF